MKFFPILLVLFFSVGSLAPVSASTNTHIYDVPSPACVAVGNQPCVHIVSPAAGTNTISPKSGTPQNGSQSSQLNLSPSAAPSISVSGTPPTGTNPTTSGGECANFNQFLHTLIPTQTSTTTKVHVKCEPSHGNNNDSNPNNGLLSQLLSLLIQLLMQLLQACGAQSPITGTPTISGTPSTSSAPMVSKTPSSSSPSVVAAPSPIAAQPAGGNNGTLKIGTNAPPTGTNAVVDFRTNLAVPALNIYSIGDTISEYGGTNANIVNTSWRNLLAKLGPLAWRLPLRYKNNTAQSAANGGGGDGTTYIKDIKSIGGVPVVIVAGDTGDYDINPTTAGQLVHFFNDKGGQNGGPVTAWIIGNEPGGGQYWNNLGAVAKAVATADPSIPVTISAPAIPDMTQGFGNGGSYQQAVQDVGQYLTYLSYHAYIGGDGKGVYSTPEYLSIAQQVKQTYNKTPGLEEFNWNSKCAGGGAGYTDWENTVYIASIIGNSLAGGAHAYMYADSNGCGTLSNGSNNGGLAFETTLPAYWALGIWTGMNGEFDRFGNQLVVTSVGGIKVTDATGKEATGLAHEVELYATNNGKIVAINKNGGAENITIGLGGLVSGTYTVWQTNAANATAPITEVKSNTSFSGSKITISLPAHTVSSIDVK